LLDYARLTNGLPVALFGFVKGEEQQMKKTSSDPVDKTERRIWFLFEIGQTR